ncbi:hypothetical protein [Microbacterium sp. LWH11-1.2]|uniref:hypothetical protein n=1 Tax=Microbacterium sp. LWH11-1.2 TaxID=3135258 RepID=UPI0031389803
MTQFASTLYPQTNPSNAVLLKIREEGVHVASDVEMIRQPQRYWLGYPVAQIYHARRVLERMHRIHG